MRIFVARRKDEVFDYFADLRNEPQYNSQVSDIKKTSSGPIGRNTTFTGFHRGFGQVSWRLTEYERPSHVVIEGRVGQGRYRWSSEFDPAPDGTWMTGRMEWESPSRWRLARPLFAALLKLNARRSFGRMARVLEEGRGPGASASRWRNRRSGGGVRPS